MDSKIRANVSTFSSCKFAAEDEGYKSFALQRWTVRTIKTQLFKIEIFHLCAQDFNDELTTECWASNDLESYKTYGEDDDCNYPYGSRWAMNVFKVVDPKINEFQKFDGEVTVQGALDLCYAKYAGPISALGFDDEGSKSEGKGSFIFYQNILIKSFYCRIEAIAI